MSSPRFFTTQRENSRELECGSFTPVLSLDVNPFNRNIQQAVKLISMVQVHFESNAEELKFRIELRLRRRRLGRDFSRELATIKLEENFIAPTMGETNQYTRPMSLNWTDRLDSRCWTEGDTDNNFFDDVDISSCRDRDCDRDRNNFRYTLLARFTPMNGFTPNNLTAQSRSLSGIVFAQSNNGGFGSFF